MPCPEEKCMHLSVFTCVKQRPRHACYTKVSTHQNLYCSWPKAINLFSPMQLMTLTRYICNGEPWVTLTHALMQFLHKLQFLGTYKYL